jgi:myosin protein heavy chain
LRAKEKKFIVDAVSQAAWAEKKLVWVEDSNEGYVEGSVVSEEGEQITVKVNDKVHSIALIISDTNFIRPLLSMPTRSTR